MMTPQADGRTYLCEYCKHTLQVAVQAHQIAAGMRVDMRDQHTFLAQLAQVLTTGFAECTKVTASGPEVHAIEIDLDPEIFMAKRAGLGILAQRRRMSRGIALKTDTLPLDRWYQALTDALARHANASAQAAAVLAQLTGQR